MPERLSKLERRVMDEIAARRDAIASLASELVSIPSVSPTLATEEERRLGSEGACNTFLARHMEAAGLDVDTFGPGAERLNAVGVLRGIGRGRSLALNGHIDTVSAGQLDLWSEDPFGTTVKNDRVWGRGATDMKGALAAMVVSVAALAAVEVELQGDLLIHSVIGEEVGDAAGTPAVLERRYGADACICAEPSHESSAGPSAALHVTSTPALVLRVSLQGRSTHSALRHEWLYPGERTTIGVNAVEKGVDLVRSIQVLEQRWGFSKRHPLFTPGQFVLHPGSFHAGEGPYLPAERCVVEYLIWHHPNESATEVRKEVTDWIDSWSSRDPWLVDNPPLVEWLGEFGNFSLPVNHPLVELVAAAYTDVVGVQPLRSGFQAGCDATALSAAGIPTLIYGPGEISIAHSVDEYVDVSQLVTASQVFALTALRWCGTDNATL
jgi:formylaminopyrimidine deformylase